MMEFFVSVVMPVEFTGTYTVLKRFLSFYI
jgi:hypothetical protein